MIEDKNYTASAPFRGTAIEVKSLDAEGRFSGYASVFDVVDSQRDCIRPGAFRKTLRARETAAKLLWQHQWENPIGVVEQIFEDAKGLFIQGRLLMDVSKAREAYALLKAGALRGMSIGYQVKQSRRDPDSGVRELLEVDLWEVSIVTLPANAQANVTVVKGAEPMDELQGLIAALSQAAHRLNY